MALDDCMDLYTTSAKLKSTVDVRRFLRFLSEDLKPLTNEAKRETSSRNAFYIIPCYNVCNDELGKWLIFKIDYKHSL